MCPRYLLYENNIWVPCLFGGVKNPSTEQKSTWSHSYFALVHSIRWSRPSMLCPTSRQSCCTRRWFSQWLHKKMDKASCSQKLSQSKFQFYRNPLCRNFSIALILTLFNLSLHFKVVAETSDLGTKYHPTVAWHGFYSKPVGCSFLPIYTFFLTP